MKIEIPPFEKARVIVVGDVMLDRYWHGDTGRISPEAPVPVVHVRQIEERPGGAANVALNISSLGGKVKLFGLVGKDEGGRSLENKLRLAGVDCYLFQFPEITTINKLRVMGRNQQLIRLDMEEGFEKCDTTEMLAVFRQQLSGANIVILSDYGKGTLRLCGEFIRLAKLAGIPVLVDPKSRDFSVYNDATVITPNLNEFEAVVGHCVNEQEIEEKGLLLLKKHGFAAVLITRGSQGMSLIQEGKESIHLLTRAREVYDVTGAGDTVIATLGAAMAAGKDLYESSILANAAAGIVVKKLGATAVSIAELCRVMQAKQDPWAGILTEEHLLQRVTDAKLHGERIVMTNGCFDLLHAGHVIYLEKAKALGDRLIVAVNDDASVKRLKGDGRPVNNLEQRMLILAALRAVDWVVPFSEDTPERLIKAVVPNVLVKGGDYKAKEIVGADFVIRNKGEVVIMPFEKGFSTSSTIDRIKER